MQPPVRPPDAKPPRSSSWSIVMALGLGLLAGGVLFFLTIGLFGLFFLAAGGMVLVTGLHYLVWGKWLSAAIYAQVEAEQREAEQLAALEREGEPVAMPPGGVVLEAKPITGNEISRNGDSAGSA